MSEEVVLYINVSQIGCLPEVQLSLEEGFVQRGGEEKLVVVRGRQRVSASGDSGPVDEPQERCVLRDEDLLPIDFLHERAS